MTVKIGDLLLRKLTQWPSNYQRTTRLDNSDRLFVHRDNEAGGRWVRPSLLVPDSSIGSEQIDEPLSRYVLDNEGGEDSSESEVTVNQGWFIADQYSLSCGVASANVRRVLWGFSASGWADVSGNDLFKILWVRARLLDGSTVLDTTPKAIAAQAYNPSGGPGAIVGGSASLSKAKTISLSADRTLSVNISAYIQTNSGVTTGTMLAASAWWTEI